MIFTKSNKILIGVALFLYFIAIYFGSLGIILHIVVIGSAIKILAKSKKSGELAVIDLTVLTAFLFIFILVRIGFLWNEYRDHKMKKEYEKKIAEQITSTPSITPTPSPIPRNLQISKLKDITTASISGLIRHIDKDLGVIVNQYEGGVDYFEVGKYISGKYKGYSRIVGFAQGATMGYQPDTYTFITSNYEKYILIENPIKVTAYPTTDYRNPLHGLNKEKITKVEEIKSDLPDVITLDETFALYKGSIQVEVDKNNIVPTDMTNNKFKLKNNFQNYNQISSQNAILKLYIIPSQEMGEWATKIYGQNGVDAYNNMLKATTGVVIQDNTGLAYSYSLYRLRNIKSNTEFTDGFFEQKNPFSSLFLSIKKSEIQTDKALFKSYSAAIPQNCSSNSSTYIVSNITPDKLISLGKTIDNIELFILNDKTNPLYQLQFASKPGEDYGKGYEEIWSIAEGKLIKHPTLEEYISKNPLLLFKDPWNRWVLLGEIDYQLPGGCGKPVAYLYPEKKEKVTVSFLQPMQFETVIPSYHENWVVNALPDGTLTDLQPQYTDCKTINSLKKGSEYAAKSCKENRYPYLYWSGNTIGFPYPDSIEKGWYVKKEEIYSFMEDKLKEIGLNQKERNDMMEYWGPQMLHKNAPYYKISFLTTQEMNRLIPMKVQPNPRSVLRVFLDFLPLFEMPKKSIQPQTLPPFTRNGFTVVEWGGLKRY